MGKAEMYLEYLRNEGYGAKLDPDGDIVFKFEGATLILYCEEDDPAFFRLVLPNFWHIDDSDERACALEAAAQAGSRVKAFKAFLVGPPDDERAWAAVEIFINPIENFELVFGRCLRVLQMGAAEFARSMCGAASVV